MHITVCVSECTYVNTCILIIYKYVYACNNLIEIDATCIYFNNLILQCFSFVKSLKFFVYDLPLSAILSNKFENVPNNKSALLKPDMLKYRKDTQICDPLRG